MSSRQLFDALLAFNQEAVPYCEGITDASAHEYAINYMRALQGRAKGPSKPGFQRTCSGRSEI